MQFKYGPVYKAISLSILIFFSFITNAQSGLVNTSKGLALQGYDAVAYFTQAKAVKGSNAYVYSYNGAKWYFANQENLNAFKISPTKYAPQYGGWCAYAMGAKGEKIDVDPETFKIIDGKLFLFYNSFLNNTLTTWNKDEKNLHAKADQNWQRIINEKH